MAKKYANLLREKLRDEIVSVYFYGSRAFGKEKIDSDLDIFIVLKKAIKYNSKPNNTIFDIANRLNTENIYISPITYSKKYFNKYENTLFINEVKKGIKV